MITGVFFHEMFKGKEWLIIGDKFRNFPGVMKHALKLPHVKMFSPEKVPEELLLKIHTPGFVQKLKQAWHGTAMGRVIPWAVALRQRK